MPARANRPKLNPRSTRKPVLAAAMEEGARRGDLYAPDCPSRGVLDHITSRWGVLVLVALLSGTHRFSELRRRIIGVSEKMLSQTLKALERDGFVDRTAYPEVPPRVEYRLTESGEEVARHIAVLTDWIEGNMTPVLAARERHDAR